MCRFAVNILMLDGFRRKAPSNTDARFSRVIRTIAAVGDCRVTPVDQNEATIYNAHSARERRNLFNPLLPMPELVS